MCSWRECTGTSATGSHESFTISACWSWTSRWSSALYSSNKRCRCCSTDRCQSIKVTWSLFHSDSTSSISFCRTRLTFWALSSGETSGRQRVTSHLKHTMSLQRRCSFVYTGYCVCVCTCCTPELRCLRFCAWLFRQERFNCVQWGDHHWLLLLDLKAYFLYPIWMEQYKKSKLANVSGKSVSIVSTHTSHNPQSLQTTVWDNAHGLQCNNNLWILGDVGDPSWI